MRKEIYYNSEDARKRAELFAEANNGFVDTRSAMVDSKMSFDYEDDTLLDMGWCGECEAYRVRSNDNYAEIGLFGYWN